MRWVLHTVTALNVASSAALLGSVHACSKRRWTRARLLSAGAGIGSTTALIFTGGGVLYAAVAPNQAAAHLHAERSERATALAAFLSQLTNTGGVAIPIGAAGAAVYGASTLASRVSRLASVWKLRELLR